MRKTLVLLMLLLPGFGKGQTIVNNSTIAFTIPEKDLLPENIAYNPNEEAYYIGSTRKGKIIKIDKDGHQSTFIEGGAFGQWMIIGMKVDAERNILWACSSGGDNLINYSLKDEKEGRPAGIFKFDLNTGKLLKRFTLEDKGGVHFFNDLVVARNGDVYATHMFGEHAIYIIPEGSNQLQLFINDGLLRYPNGITMADNQKVMFVAHSDGLARIDIETKQVTSLSVPDEVKVTRKESLDGLYYYKWSLIGVQPDMKSINRYYLNEKGDGIERVEILEQNHPMMDHPTTGVRVGNDFYYIANSQFERFNDDGTLFPMEKLYEVVVLKLKLD